MIVWEDKPYRVRNPNGGDRPPHERDLTGSVESLKQLKTGFIPGYSLTDNPIHFSQKVYYDTGNEVRTPMQEREQESVGYDYPYYY